MGFAGFWNCICQPTCAGLMPTTCLAMAGRCTALLDAPKHSAKDLAQENFRRFGSFLFALASRIFHTIFERAKRCIFTEHLKNCVGVIISTCQCKWWKSRWMVKTTKEMETKTPNIALWNESVSRLEIYGVIFQCPGFSLPSAIMLTDPAQCCHEVRLCVVEQLLYSDQRWKHFHDGLKRTSVRHLYSSLGIFLDERHYYTGKIIIIIMKNLLKEAIPPSASDTSFLCCLRSLFCIS